MLKVGSKFKTGSTLTLIGEVTKIEDGWVYYKLIDDFSSNFYDKTGFVNEGMFQIGSPKYGEACAELLVQPQVNFI